MINTWGDFTCALSVVKGRLCTFPLYKLCMFDGLFSPLGATNLRYTWIQHYYTCYVCLHMFCCHGNQ